MWFIFSLISAILYSFRGVLEKTTIHRTNKYILGLGIRLFALPFFVLPFIFQPELLISLQKIPGEFWLAVIVISCISTPLETIFYYQAIKEEELTLALPILSLSPALTIGFAALILGQYPSLFGALGVAVILLGVYALKISYAREGLLTPLKHLAHSRGVQFMAIVACSLALGGIFDTMGVKASNAYMYAFFNYLFVCIVLFILAIIKAPKQLHQLKQHACSLSLIGAVVAGYTLFYLLALKSGNTAYVVSIRSASVLFSIFLGIVIFKEKDLKSKILAGGLIFLGLLCIKVLG